MIIIELIHNLSILIALSIISGFLDRRYPRTTLTGRILQGILFGTVAILGMLKPLVFNEGLIFDGRSVVISLSTLFFGPIAGSIAGLMAIIFRIIQNGFGIVPGTLVIISSVVIGSIFHFQWKKRNNEIRVRQLLYLGVSVHFVMLLMMFSLPYSIAITVIQKIGIAVILLYPLATVLIGKILSDQEINFRVIENIKANELKFRMVADLTYGWEYWENENQKLVYISPSCERITGYTQDEFYSNPSLLEKIVYHEDSENYIKHSTKVYSIEHKDVADNLEFRIVKKDDSIVNIYHICRPVFDSNHKFLGRRVSNKDITERKKADEALHMSEQLFHTLAQVSPVGIFRTDINGYTTYVNPRWSQLSGVAFQDALGYGWLNAVHPDDKEKLNQGWHESTRDQKESYSEYRFLRPDGTIAWVIGQAIPEMNSENQIVGYIGTITDITDRKNVEKTLRESEAKLDEALKIAKLGTWEYDVAQDQFSFNDQFYAVLHTTAEREGGYIMSSMQYAKKFVYPDDMALVGTETKKALETSDPNYISRLDHRIICADGEIGYFNVNIKIVKDIHGRTVKTYGVNQVITERKKSEEALIASEEKHRALIEHMYEGLLVVDNDDVIQFANPMFCKMLGYKETELIDKIGYIIFLDETERIKIIEKNSNRLKGISEQYELRMIKKSGEQITVFMNATPVIDKKGKVIGSMSTCIDITEQKKANNALMESEKRFRSVWVNSLDGMRLSDAEGKIIKVNDSYCEMVEKDRSELESFKISIIQREGLQNHILEIHQKRFNEKDIQKYFEREIVLWNGKKKWFGVSNAFVELGNGETLLLGIFRDITENKYAEIELIKAKGRAEQSDQLKSEFINQISHEIRSPMNAVLSFTNLLKEEMLEKLTPDLLEYLKGIDSAGHRLMRTIDLILNFSEIQVGTYKPFFTRFDLLKEIIEKIINENKRAVEEKGLILNFLSTPLEAVIKGDQYSIHQIFANLIDNSIKYTKEGYISINVSKDDRGIIVKIEDTGIGMSEEFMERMYHPFTQEERGYSRSYDGSGLGLSLVKKYCDLNNIDITVESMKGVGTKFTLFFAKTE